MGKRRSPPQNDKVAEENEDVDRPSRLRPEEILARSFPEPVPESATVGWSVRSRRTILVAMAVAGALMVSLGLALTGGLGPGPSSPRPIETGPDASVLAQQLLRLPAEEPGSTATTEVPAVPRKTNRSSSDTSASAPTAAPSSSTTPTAPGASTSRPAAAPSTTSTTRPCSVLSSRINEAVGLPLCP